MTARTIWTMILVLTLLTACAPAEATPVPPTEATAPSPASSENDSLPDTPTPEPTTTTPIPDDEANGEDDADLPTVTPEADADEAEPAAPRLETVVTGLQTPWALAFAPDGRLFITERDGALRVVVDGVLQPDPVAELPVAAVGEGGLMGLALDPDFEDNGYLYMMYTYQQGGTLMNRISRLTLIDGRAGDEQVLLDAIPGGRIHNGGRIAFGPDGLLYATTGDAGSMALAQDPDSPAGKILRLNADGSVPEDNPIPGSYVYSIGHRNPQGLAWHPDTGQLFSTEHGPTGEMGRCCHDEVNRIEAGENYGWPEIVGDGGEPQYRDPVLHSGDETWAPGDVAFYDGGPLTRWQGNLFFAGLRGAGLYRVALGGDDGAEVIEFEPLYRDELGRLRAVTMGPDGHLYFASSNRDGRGRPREGDDQVYRIVPEN
ncbi:MAG: PQQ-dependent sugar dehydrogenase [Anaerolineae bacterium]|jgi:glucose/arabinose dehydrogenase